MFKYLLALSSDMGNKFELYKPVKIPLPKLRIRYQGLFDLQGLYAAVQTWCKDHGYEWQERAAKHKVPGPRGAEQEMEWVITRWVTDYILYEVQIWVHAWELTEVMIQQKGKKRKLTNARIELMFEGVVQYDWQKIWGKSSFTRWLGRIYDKYVMRRDLEGIYVDGLVYSMYDLHALVRKQLDMQAKAHEYKGYMR